MLPPIEIEIIPLHQHPLHKQHDDSALPKMKDTNTEKKFHHMYYPQRKRVKMTEDMAFVQVSKPFVEKQMFKMSKDLTRIVRDEYARLVKIKSSFESKAIPNNDAHLDSFVKWCTFDPFAQAVQQSYQPENKYVGLRLPKLMETELLREKLKDQLFMKGVPHEMFAKKESDFLRQVFKHASSAK